MTDNFNKIKNIIEFDDENDFYFIQVLKRRKENPEMKSGVKVIQNYYYYQTDDFNRLKEKIIDQCNKNNARAYISLNRCNAKLVALYTSKIILDYIIEGNYKKVHKAYAAACGGHTSEVNKKWVIDVDEEDLNKLNDIISVINNLHLEIKNKNYKIIDILNTRTGKHIITNPFNKEKFAKLFPTIDVQKNSPTVLYTI